MANYYGTARSNYFRVKHAGRFKAWAEKRRLIVWVRHGLKRNTTYYGITPADTDCGGWPSYDFDAPENEQEFDVALELAKHLVPGSVAVLMEAGAEKLRYITGYAVAVNSKGETVDISLHDICKKAKRLGTEITPAEY